MMSDSPASDAHVPTPLFHDRAFLGMTSTQFLGAFNDNLFKQLVMLICVDVERLTGEVFYQPLALALFAIPFVMFSGFAGFLSDKFSKRSIVVGMKVAEIVIMFAGLGAFFLGSMAPDWQLPMLFVVLFLMSTQSAFFGPAKYGILPELFANRDLPQANGMIQMTTFLAIIFGFAAAGYGKEGFQDQLWFVSALCVGIAVLGTFTSLLIRRTPIADPDLKFELSALGINRETWNMLRGDRLLVEVLLISSLFWFLGGVMQPTTNTFGKDHLGLGDADTSLLGAFMGIGIALGCVVAGKLSHEQVNFGLVRIGSWGLVSSLAFLCFLGFSYVADSASIGARLFPPSMTETWSRVGMFGVGIFGGLFIVPLQVFLQARPPEDQKGRMIGTMNLINWLAICLAAAFVGISTAILKYLVWDTYWIFGLMALLLLPVAIFYHPHDETLGNGAKA